MRTLIASVAMLFVVGMAANAQAQCCDKATKGENTSAKVMLTSGGEKCTKSGDGCSKDAAACAAKCGDKAGTCSDKAACSGAAGMPAMMFKVGDKTTRCPKEASELAGNDSSKILYVVGDQEFTCKDKALAAYAKALDNHLSQFTTVKYAVGSKCVQCPMEAAKLAKSEHKDMQYQVGTFKFASQEKAQQAVEAARKAIEKVNMQCVVDGHTYNYCDKTNKMSCPVSGKEIQAKCDDNGKPEVKNAEWVVGETKTNSESDARIELTRARIVAATEAVEAAAGA